jgi:hypothetical protein
MSLARLHLCGAVTILRSLVCLTLLYHPVVTTFHCPWPFDKLLKVFKGRSSNCYKYLSPPSAQLFQVLTLTLDLIAISYHALQSNCYKCWPAPLSNCYLWRPCPFLLFLFHMLTLTYCPTVTYVYLTLISAVTNTDLAPLSNHYMWRTGHWF